MRATTAALTVGLVACAAAGGMLVREPAAPSSAPPASPAVGSPLVLFEEGFEDDAFAARGWYDGRPFTTTDAERRSGRRALEARFARGSQKPAWGAARRLFEPTASVYLGYWVKYSPDWRGSGRPYHPHEFSILTTADDRWTGPAFTHLTVYVEHNVHDGGVPVVAIQDGANVDTARIGRDLTGVTEARAVAGCNGSRGAVRPSCYRTGARHFNGITWRAAAASFRPVPGPGYLGDWNHVEAYFQLNTVRDGVGVADGVIRYWFNGALVLEVTGVLMRTGAHPGMRFNQLFVGPYIGDGSPVDQAMWIDDIRVGTQRP